MWEPTNIYVIIWLWFVCTTETIFYNVWNDARKKAEC
jgi:hypothetical protein